MEQNGERFHSKKRKREKNILKKRKKEEEEQECNEEKTKFQRKNVKMKWRKSIVIPPKKKLDHRPKLHRKFLGRKAPLLFVDCELWRLRKSPTCCPLCVIIMIDQPQRFDRVVHSELG